MCQRVSPLPLCGSAGFQPAYLPFAWLARILTYIVCGIWIRHGQTLNLNYARSGRFEDGGSREAQVSQRHIRTFCVSAGSRCCGVLRTSDQNGNQIRSGPASSTTGNRPKLSGSRRFTIGAIEQKPIASRKTDHLSDCAICLWPGPWDRAIGSSCPHLQVSPCLLAYHLLALQTPSAVGILLHGVRAARWHSLRFLRVPRLLRLPVWIPHRNFVQELQHISFSQLPARLSQRLHLPAFHRQHQRVH